MANDTSKKLFIFIGMVLVVILLGPYLGIHLLGDPEIPERQSHAISHPAPMPDPMLDPELMLNGEIPPDIEEESDDGEDQ